MIVNVGGTTIESYVKCAETVVTLDTVSYTHLHEFKQGYRFDPAKIDWANLKKVGITADTLKNTRDFDRVMRGYKSRNTYTCLLYTSNRRSSIAPG